MSRHRVGRHRATPTRPAGPAWWWPLAAAALGAVLAAGAALTGPTPPAPAAAAQAAPPVRTVAAFPVALPVPEVAPTMVVYDDNPGRGRDRCTAWASLYTPARATCTVNPTRASPNPARARTGQQWWNNRYPDDSEAGSK